MESKSIKWETTDKGRDYRVMMCQDRDILLVVIRWNANYTTIRIKQGDETKFFEDFDRPGKGNKMTISKGIAWGKAKVHRMIENGDL